jgi:hypothetical protein
MTVREYGFEPNVDESRIGNLLAALDDEQREQLVHLAGFKSEYYRDAKEFLKRDFASILADEDESDEQKLVDLTLAAGDIVLRAISKFMLNMGEIVVFGQVQGSVPMETERIIEI